MRPFKHIGVGFLVSFIGSLPLGYLNVAGLQVYQEGIERLFWYLLGVISVEVIIIYLTLIFAEKLVAKRKLLQVIEVFTFLFMFVLAAVFYGEAVYGIETVSVSGGDAKIYPPYLLGVVLSCLNFLQLPFWVGWNLYLLKKKHIEPGRRNEVFYVFGTGLGTFLGMLAFVLVLAKLDTAFLSGYLMHVIAAGFAIIGLVQAWKYFRKHHTFKKQ